MKLRLPAELCSKCESPFPAVEQNAAVCGQLLLALEELHSVMVVDHERTPFLLARLVEPLCLWPRARGQFVTDRRQVACTVPKPGAIENAIELVKSNIANPMRVEELADAVGLSPRQLERRFRENLGIGPHAYTTKLRLERARQILSASHLTVTEVAEALHFQSVHTFSQWFRKGTGVSPTEYRMRFGTTL